MFRCPSPSHEALDIGYFDRDECREVFTTLVGDQECVLEPKAEAHRGDLHRRFDREDLSRHQGFAATSDDVDFGADSVPKSGCHTRTLALEESLR